MSTNWRAVACAVANNTKHNARVVNMIFFISLGGQDFHFYQRTFRQIFNGHR